MFKWSYKAHFVGGESNNRPNFAMASAQPQVMFATGGVQGATVFATPMQVGDSGSTLTEKEKATLQFFSRVSMSLYIIGSLSIVLGVGVLATGATALALGSVVEIIFSFVWGGFAFAIVNGALAIKSAKLQPNISMHWCKVLLGVGSVSLVMHVIDLIIACVSASIYDDRNNYYYSQCGSGSNCYSYYTFYVTATSSEAPRIVMLLLLLTGDIGILIAASKSKKMLVQQQHNAVPATAGFTVIQANAPAASTSYVLVPATQMNNVTPTAYVLQPAAQPVMSMPMSMPMAMSMPVQQPAGPKAYGNDCDPPPYPTYNS